MTQALTTHGEPALHAVAHSSVARAFVISILFLALTVPRLVVNYGADGDALRNVVGAERLVETGTYWPVRLPGSPLFDWLLAGVVCWGGHYAANAVVLLCFLGCIAVFTRLSRSVPHGPLLALLFAFTPLLLKNAATAMDYVPGLALLLSSYLALRQRRIVLAALLLGCSAGMRITNAVWILPATVYILSRKWSFKAAAAQAALAAILGLALNGPLLLHLMTAGTVVNAVRQPLLFKTLLAGHNAMSLWGPPATLAISLVCTLNAKRLWSAVVRARSDPEILVELLTMLLFVGLFLVLPDEPEYLLPVIPFAYLFMARCLPRKHLVLVAGAVLLTGFVSLEMKGGTSGQRRVQVRPAPGILVKDLLDRREFEALRAGLESLPAPGKAVVLAGIDLPLTYRNPHVECVPLDRFPDVRDAFRYTAEDPLLHRIQGTICKLKGRDVFLVTSLPKRICQDLQWRGYTLYIFSALAPRYALTMHGYNPDELGIEKLDISGPSAFFRRPPRIARVASPSPDSWPKDHFVTDRPRLFVNRETLPAVRARALGELRPLYEERKKAVEAVGYRDLGVPGDFGMEAASAAFGYLCEGSSNQLALATRLLESACAYYRQCDESRRRVNWYAFSRIHALAAYDWLYESMEPELRARLGRDLLDHVERNQPGSAPPPGANLTDHRSGLYGERALLWYAGIALKGAGIDEAKAELAIALGYDLNMKMLNYRQRVAGDDGGMATPTLGYALRATPWAEFNFFHTMKSAFGRDIAADWPHVARFPNYILWNWLPGGREFGAGDTDHVSNRMQTEQIYSHCAQIRHFFGGTAPEWAAFAAWVQEQCPSRTYFTAASPIAPFLLTRLSGSPPAAAPPADLPLARHFAGLGQIFMRSGQDDDDTYALFTAGGCTEGILAHRHYDQNSFTIFRGGFLAIDSGSRPEPGNHLPQYFGRSVAHNAMLIRMDGEVLPRYWGAAAPGEDALGVANDGGMCSLTGAVVRAFVTTPDYTYIASDATTCYTPAKCRLATRQFIHLQPDAFVVFDRVSAVKPEFRKTWLLHTVSEPRMADSTFVAEHGEGRLFCRTLLPTVAVLEKIGGPGKEFWSDGRNWPFPPQATFAPGVPLRQTELMGGWRVEVAPSVPSQDDCFLHLIEVGGLEKTNMAPARLLQETEWAGVALTRNATTWSVRFRTRGELGADIAIERGTNMVVIPLPNTVQAQSGLARTGARP